MKNITQNYTPEMEQEIRENSPITYDLAVILAERFGKKLRSVIAKACSMEKVDYIARERVAKNGNPIVRKVEIVASIAKHLESDEDFEGLEKATKESLEALLNGLREANAN
jgi:hypothetical protein|tara:strand:- start:157 stop:489 length:333 start_codon:yes stop_codon:yes gene_type:complete